MIILVEVSDQLGEHSCNFFTKINASALFEFSVTEERHHIMVFQILWISIKYIFIMVLKGLITANIPSNYHGQKSLATMTFLSKGGGGGESLFEHLKQKMLYQISPYTAPKKCIFFLYIYITKQAFYFQTLIRTYLGFLSPPLLSLKGTKYDLNLELVSI